jgi:hypothetical protein
MAEPEMKRQNSPILKRGDIGPDVTEAQNFLNRNGAILDPDGKFGPGTETAIREFQATRSIPVTGIIDPATWTALRALQEPSPEIPTRAVAFIGREEVGSRAQYDMMQSPTWPGGASGVTIGIGYDLGYQTTFESDWAGLLTAAQMAALRRWIGVRGQSAAAGPAVLRNITIPWSAAWMVFIGRSLPQTIFDTRKVFRPSVEMPRLCRGVLVSLVYNRGTSMTDSVSNPGCRREMREIRDAVAAGHLSNVPDLLRSMKRLWPESNGLRDRVSARHSSSRSAWISCKVREDPELWRERDRNSSDISDDAGNSGFAGGERHCFRSRAHFRRDSCSRRPRVGDGGFRRAGDSGAATSLSALAQTDEQGRYRLEGIPVGRYYIAAGRVDLPTFYPGTSDLTKARVFSVTPGGAVSGIDFVMLDTSVRVIPANGPGLAHRRWGNHHCIHANIHTC